MEFVQLIDHIAPQFNPASTGCEIANILPMSGEIAGIAPGFIVGSGEIHHFQEPGLHHLPAIRHCHLSASEPCHSSASGPYHSSLGGPCHSSASVPCHSSSSGPHHPSARGPSRPSASEPETLCRQFWKAGDYTPSLNYSAPLPAGGQNRMRIHPKFLHSNATSHKWAFGGQPHFLFSFFSNVVNGATSVKVDNIINPKDGSCCLLIQDDGGGMGPDTLRQCMGFGYSNKCSGFSIGQYGNGFKTSTMRLGADVIVFTRSLKERGLTQSVGLLSYTLLRNFGCEDIIVPTVDYVFEATRGRFERLCGSDEKFYSNLSILLSWSPFGTELELQKQFDEIGAHGTRIIVFNLWRNDAGEMELDIKSNNQDILISGSPRAETTNNAVKLLNQMHTANQYRYSLRVYASILYLHLPMGFRIVICGRDVDHHYLINDLEHRQCIAYRPKVGCGFEAEVTTVIGFLKGAPNVNVHGFCIYHKNRLILPFMPVVHSTNGKCRGVAGVLEANFIKPTHDKQDFEKSALFQKLEIRLRDMAKEYWDLFRHLVGYKSGKNISSKRATCNMPSSTNGEHEAVLTSLSRGPRENSEQSLHGHGLREPLNNRFPSTGINDFSHLFEPVFFGKRNEMRAVDASEASRVKRRAILSTDLERTSHAAHATQGMEEKQREHLRCLASENKKLSSQCSEYEASEKELSLKAQLLTLELQNAQQVYGDLLSQLALFNHVNIQRF
ncbi:MORC family CW-type zinc finger protein 3 [Carex littledalei]|uniref:MORC family CW-type zinc finger protein 3 n=1 Tax=Carex littledalei TaxID=544730 RepID=A0A833VBR7_9POAL|nr:MORC family CW-type zinc finger protein 3 [Carex littledalei]